MSVHVGVTGGAGFFGWHMRVQCHLRDVAAAVADRATFADAAKLDDFVRSSRAIVHAAGVNRAEPETVESANPNLARALVESLQRTGAVVPIVYTNSTHSSGDSVYGRSKRLAGEILAAHQSSVGAPFVNLVLPHLFGEFGRPHYNSAITTFAYELANGGKPEVNPSGQLELVHAQDAAKRCLELVDAVEGEVTEHMTGRQISVGEAWDLMQQQHARYVSDFTVPPFGDRFELQLFNAIRAQLYESGFYPRPLVLHEDNRGAFVELARADGVGQTSLSTSVPGIVRGDHFHVDKIERFVVVQGQATISMRRVLTSEVRSFDVTADEPVFIDMPPLVTHRIENTGSSAMTTIFWAGDHFDPAVPDTYIDPVPVP